MTNKEKMARRRARLKENPVQNAVYLEKERNRKKAQRDKVKEFATEEDIREFRRKESKRVLSYYYKNKSGKNEGPEEEQKTPEKSPFQSRQSLGKAMKRVTNSLPYSPRKKKFVVRCLMRKCGIKSSNDLSKDHHRLSLSPEILQKVSEFYNSDEVSWQAPGKKDRVIYRKKNDQGKTEKEYVQSRYLLMSLREAYTLFKEKNPDSKIGKSRFCNAKPKHVLCFADLPHNVCVCVYHENIRLILSALKSHSELPIEFKPFIDKIVCNSKSKDCMTQSCLICRNKIDLYTPENLEEPLKYLQWQKVDNKSQKVEILSTVHGVFDELKAQLKYFLIHTFVKRAQADTFNNLKSAVDGSNILIQLDFSENASLLAQNEIQSAHWSHSQATVFTAYAWISESLRESCVIVSDDLEHTKTQIYCYINYLLNYLKQTYPDIANVSVFSDGTSAQFKNRYMFSCLHMLEQNFKIKLTWNFFATSHGKGVVDGIGGTIKRSVWNYVKSTPHIIVNTANEFARVAAEKNPNVMVAFVTKDEVNKKVMEVESLWSSAIAVPDTHSVHCVSLTNNNNYIVVGDTSDDMNKRNIRILPRNINSSSDESDGYDDESNIAYPQIQVKNLKTSDWVVVCYDNVYYPGEVKIVGKNEVQVKVMHSSKTGAYYYWPEEEDCICYHQKQVIKKIEGPIPCGGTRGHFKFLVNIP